jgi:hypothetical protein
MVEYNQCQATLKTLYELGIPGKVEEFTAYRILMLLHGLNKSGAHIFPFVFEASAAVLIILVCLCHRIKSLCRSANAQTESGSRRSARA